MIKILLIVVPAVLIISLGVFFGIQYLNPDKIGPTTPTPPITQDDVSPQPTLIPRNPQIILNAKTTTSANTTNLELSFDPQRPNIPINAVALRLIISSSSGKVTAAVPNPTLNQDLRSSDWSFPFAKLTPLENGDLALEVSAIHISTQPHLMLPNEMWFTIPLASPADRLTVTVDSEFSKVMEQSGQAITELHFIGEDIPQTVN